MLTLAFAPDRPAPPDAGREVQVWRGQTGEIFARLFRGAGRRRIEWRGVGAFDCCETSTAVEVSPAPGASLDAIHDAFDRAVHPAFLQTRPGFQALHASAALVDDGAIAFCGRSGAGKSTLAYACGRAGFTHFADDALALDLRENPAAALGLPFTLRLRAATADHFDVRGPQPSRMLPARAPLRAVCLLHGNARHPGPHLSRMRPVAAFSRLLTHAHSFDPHDPAETKRMTEDFLRLAQDVPVYEVAFAPGLEALPDLITAVVATVRSMADGRREITRTAAPEMVTSDVR